MNHKTAHIVNKRQPWLDTRGAKQYARSTTTHAIIFAMTSGIRWNKNTWAPNYPDLVEVKLHSMQTWKYAMPENITASTELHLTREDASKLAALLLAAVNDMDQERGK